MNKTTYLLDIYNGAVQSELQKLGMSIDSPKAKSLLEMMRSVKAKDAAAAMVASGVKKPAPRKFLSEAMLGRR